MLWDESQDRLEFVDSVSAVFGSGADLQIMHNGTNTLVDNITGDLYIRQYTDDGDIIFVCDDGSGGTTAYLTLDGGSGYTKATKDIRFDDNISARFGTGSDLTIKHDGTDSTINNAVGDLIIKNSTDDKDIKFECDDGSGGTTTYFKLDGGTSKTIFSKNVEFGDNVELQMGGSTGLKIEHNGTHSYFDNSTGDIIFRQYTDDKDIIFQCDDGSGGITTYLTLDGGLGFTQAQKKIRFKDSVEAEFGDQGDFLIKHTGSHADLTNGTGDIRITNNTDDADILLKTDNGSGGVTTYIQLDGSDLSTKILTQKLIISNLPTSDPGVDGQVWNNSGVLNISSG